MLKRVEAPGSAVSAKGEVRHCEICGGTHTTEVSAYSKKPWTMAQCSGCGFVFLESVPDYEDLIEEYAWEKSFATEKKRRRSTRFGWLDTATRWRLAAGHIVDRQRRRRTLGLTGNVLDVGCGGNCRVPHGPTPHGIEISAALAAEAQPSFRARGGRVIHAPAIAGLDAFDDGFFSSILMRSYLEHEKQPRLVLERAFHKLAPGGRIFIRLPDYGSLNRRLMGARWCGFRYPDHVNYFTNRSLRSLSEGLGYSYSRTNWYSPFDDNIIAVLTRPKIA